MAQVLFPGLRATDANGDPLPGALLEVYEAGTTTPLDVYTDSALTTAASNPVVCDAGGLLPVIYGAPDDYKFVLKTSGGSEVQTIDNFTLIDPATATAVASQTVTSNTTVAADDLDRLFRVDASSGDVTLTANSSTLGSGFTFSVILVSATASGDGIVQPGGGQTVNGAATHTVASQYDSATYRSNGAGGWDILAQTIDTATLVSDNAIQKLQVALNAGEFQYSSATVCTLVQNRGGYVCFPNGTSLPIGSSGISTTYNNATINGTAAQTLTASTLYYAYAYDNSGSLAIDWSTTGHSADTTTGIEIKTGDSTRVLVGMVYTNASSQFDNSATKRNVASWNNRSNRNMVNTFTVDRAYASAAWGEVNAEIRCEFVSWGDAVSFICNANIDGIPNTNDEFQAAVTLDGNTTPTIIGSLSDPDGGSYDATDAMSNTSGGWFAAAEGHHYATLMAAHGSSSSADHTPESSISGMVTS